MGLISKKAAFPPLGLLTVAAMLPDGWEKRLVDMNVRPLRDADIRWADYVFVSAMDVQRASAEDVIGKRVARGKGPARPADFQINFDESEKAYFVDDQMTLAPKEIVVLEVEARDVWTVPQKTIDDLKIQAETLVKARPRGEGEEESRPDPVAVKLKEEIFRQLEQVVEAQKAGGITQAGVQGHIDAYQKNREILQQVGMDLAMLRNITNAREIPEEGGESRSPQGANETQTQPQAPSPVARGADAVTGPEPQKETVADKLKNLFRWK